MRILLIHQNFPGQFRHVAPVWARRPGWQVMAIGRDTCPGLPDVPEIQLLRYRPHRQGHKEQHPYLRKMEDAVLHGQAVARVLQSLKQPQSKKQQHSSREAEGKGANTDAKPTVQSFTPDVILAHPGWGETLYAKDVFPHARLIHLCEWYYSPHGADTNFDPEFPASLDDQLRIRTWNALHLLNLEHCDAAISPTRWQRAQHPAIYHPKIHVAHEGIHTEGLGPDAEATFTVPPKPNLHKAAAAAPALLSVSPPDSIEATPPPPITKGDEPQPLTLHAGAPIITYVARNLEPYRGFHQFMRALEIIQREHPTAQTLIVGGDEVSYGKRPQGPGAAPNWRTQMLGQCRIDTTRTHFLGRIPYEQYKKVLQVSAAHVYLTVPFVLSWSMLEAMASGCLVIASNTRPVREVIEDGVNGLLVDFFNAQDIARQVLHSLQEPRLSIPLRQAARTAVQKKFNLQSGIAAYEALLKVPQRGASETDYRYPHQRVFSRG